MMLSHKLTVDCKHHSSQLMTEMVVVEALSLLS